MIAGGWERIKGWIYANRGDIFLFASIVLISLASFGLGRLSVIWQPKTPISVTRENTEAALLPGKTAGAKSESSQSASRDLSPLDGVVASKNGSSYHLPSCPGAKKIKPENLVQFKTSKEAQQAGYKPAGNCPGLE